MTNISKIPLEPSQENALFTQLSKLFSNRSSKEIHNLLSDLLGTEEKIMLAKRLAIIVMISRKQTIYFIAHSLHVSTATVKRIHLLMEDEQFSHITKTFTNSNPKRNSFDILQAIDDILHLGGVLPHYGQTHKSESYKKERAQRAKYKKQRRL